MFADTLTILDVKRGVDAYNSLYAEMERALWCLSQAAANDVWEQKESVVIEALVWTIRSWWGVQFVGKDTKVIAAASLLKLDWDRRLYEQTTDLGLGSEKFAVECVSKYVEGMVDMGAPRREWSLASKVLHWLMPWHIPVYDSFVRKGLGISQGADPQDAYRRIVRSEFKVAQKLLREGLGWLGNVEPQSPFRALDKYLWWHGGGYANRSIVVKDPWQKISSLGLKAC